jgi:hypothetical protein
MANTGQCRGRLAAVLLQLTKAQQEEDRAYRIGLAPDCAVEPGDRIDKNDRGGDQGPAVAGAEVADN